MIALRKEIIDRIKADKSLKIAVQSVLNISHTTMYKYLSTNDARLTNLNIIQMLVNETGLPECDIITD